MKSILLTIFALSIFACTGHSHPSENNMPEKKEITTDTLELKLKGKWELIKVVCCGRNAQEKIYGEFDRKEYIKFYIGKKKMVKTFDMGFLIRKEKYSFTQLPGSEESTQRFIQIGDKNQPAMISVESDTLIISREYMDLERKYYKRVKPR